MSGSSRLIAAGSAILAVLLCGSDASAQTLTPRDIWEQPSTPPRPSPNTPAPTRFGAECVGVVKPADLAPGDPRFSPGRPMVLLPDFPVSRKMDGAELTLRYLIRANGTVDSVQVTGSPDASYARRYEEKLRQLTAKQLLHPAVFDGCAVDWWFSTMITLNR